MLSDTMLALACAIHFSDNLLIGTGLARRLWPTPDSMFVAMDAGFKEPVAMAAACKPCMLRSFTSSCVPCGRGFKPYLLLWFIKLFVYLNIRVNRNIPKHMKYEI